MRGGAVAYIRGARFVSPDYVLASADYPVRPSETVILELIALAPNISNSTTVSAQEPKSAPLRMHCTASAQPQGRNGARCVM